MKASYPPQRFGIPSKKVLRPFFQKSLLVSCICLLFEEANTTFGVNLTPKQEYAHCRSEASFCFPSFFCGGWFRQTVMTFLMLDVLAELPANGMHLRK